MINPILKPNIGGGAPMIVLCEYQVAGTIWVSLDGGVTWEERASTFNYHKPRGIAIGGDIRNIVVTGNSSNTTDQFTAYATEDGAFAAYSGGSDSYAAPAYVSLDGTHFYSLRTHTAEIISYSPNEGASWAVRTGNGDQPIQLCSTRDNLTVWVAHNYTTHKYLRKFTNGINNSTSITVTPFGAGRHNSVACSGDGKYVYAGEGFLTYMKVAVSSNYGVNWSISTLATGSATGTFSARVFCNESGQYVLVSSSTTTPYTTKLSHDYGQTWSSISINGYNPYIAYSTPISMSGRYMIMGDVVDNNIYHISADYGATWNTVSSPTGFYTGRVIDACIQDPIGGGSSGIIQTSISTLTSALTSQLTSTSWNTTIGSSVNTITSWGTEHVNIKNTIFPTSRDTYTSANTITQTLVQTMSQTWTLTNYVSAQWMTVEYPTLWNTLKDTILGITIKTTQTVYNTNKSTLSYWTLLTNTLTATGGASQVATSKDTTTSWNTDKNTTTSWNTSE